MCQRLWRVLLLETSWGNWVTIVGSDLSENDSYCFRSKHSCFWNDSNNNCYWSKHDCSGNNSISFKMMLMLEWSGSREGNSYLIDKLSRLMFLRGSNNNKPIWWKRIRKKIQIQFLCPWLNQILNSTILANNNKRSELVCIMGD